MKSTGRTKRHLMLYIILFVALTSIGLFLVLNSPSQAAKRGILWVVNLNDDGSGSLRQALVEANASPGIETIKFAISGTIPVLANLDFRDQSGVVLDGFSAPRPGIILNISGECQLEVMSSNNVIRGLTIVGTDWGSWGIQLCGGTWSGICENNLVQGNSIKGCRLAVLINQSSKNVIKDNVISECDFGVLLSSESPPPNDENVIEDNVLGNNLHGIHIAQGIGNIIRGNYVGLDQAGNPLPNGKGIWIYGVPGSTVPATAKNTVGPGNVIAFNQIAGILVEGQVAGIKITRNSIFDNTGGGIFLGENPNGNLPPPSLLTTYPISGIAPPYSTVELFSDAGAQGRFFIGTVKADQMGKFTNAYTLSGLCGNVTATATDKDGNTSMFSAPVPILPIH
jgi:hypothetical protein